MSNIIIIIYLIIEVIVAILITLSWIYGEHRIKRSRLRHPGMGCHNWYRNLQRPKDHSEPWANYNQNVMMNFDATIQGMS